MVKSMKTVSQRTGTQCSPGSEFLATRFGSKALHVTVTMQPQRLVADGTLPEGDDVQVALLENPYRLSRELTNILGSAKSGDSLLLVCGGGKLYRSTLQFLGLG